jgi:hypothetical protein
MKYALLLSVLLLTACDASTPQRVAQRNPILSYQELVEYKPDCDKKDQQLAELLHVQTAKNFAKDPDELSDGDRAYNSRLKATIWWYSYRCGQ